MSKSVVLSVLAICIFGLVACEPVEYDDCGGGKKDEKTEILCFLGGVELHGTIYFNITRLSISEFF